MKKAIAALALTLALCGCSNTTTVMQDKENEGRFRCESGQVYLVTDTRTRVQYLVWRDFQKGGVCVLVDKDGRPLLAGEDE